MSIKHRGRHKNRQEKGLFFMLPHSVTDSASFAALSHKAVRMLIEIGLQYRGYNNGDLDATYSRLSKRGLTSKDVNTKAVRELLDAGFIELTRQGGRNIPNLYAITWQKIDLCGNKLDVSPTSAPSNKYSKLAYSLPLNGGSQHRRAG